MLLVMNIGNTHTQTALFDGFSFIEQRKFPTVDFNNETIPDNMPVAAATVVPTIREQLRRHDIFWVTPETCGDLDLSAIDVSTVGADRLANAIYLLEYAETLPAVCFDFGTAITMEVIDSQKCFRGGAIAPGRMLLRQALHHYTAQLPLVPLNIPPPDITGANTRDAILLGTDRGVIGSVKELMAVAQNMFSNQKITFTGIGGDASFFIAAIPEIKAGGEEFTLHGIRRSWEYYNK